MAFSYNEKQQLQNEIEQARRAHRFSITMGPTQRGKIEEQMMTGGFTANDIQNLTSQDRFTREESTDLVDSDGEVVDVAPPTRMSIAPRASLGGDRLQKQRGIMKKAQSLEVDEGNQVNNGSALNGGVSFTQQPLTGKRLPRSASEDRFNNAR